MSMKMIEFKNSCFQSQGFTLIEVLVAVLILSLGVLGIAGMQVLSTRDNFEASQRTQATQIANAALDRMRANATNLSSYAGTMGGSSISSAPTACSNCTGAQIASHDQWELQQLVNNSDSLLSPRICITNSATTSGVVSIVVAWRGVSKSTVSPASGSCGLDVIGSDYYKQVTISSYIAPENP